MSKFSSISNLTIPTIGLTSILGCCVLFSQYHSSITQNIFNTSSSIGVSLSEDLSSSNMTITSKNVHSKALITKALKDFVNNTGDDEDTLIQNILTIAPESLDDSDIHAQLDLAKDIKVLQKQSEESSEHIIQLTQKQTEEAAELLALQQTQEQQRNALSIIQNQATSTQALINFYSSVNIDSAIVSAQSKLQNIQNTIALNEQKIALTNSEINDKSSEKTKAHGKINHMEIKIKSSQTLTTNKNKKIKELTESLNKNNNSTAQIKKIKQDIAALTFTVTQSERHTIRDTKIKNENEAKKTKLEQEIAQTTVQFETLSTDTAKLKLQEKQDQDQLDLLLKQKQQHHSLSTHNIQLHEELNRIKQTLLTSGTQISIATANLDRVQNQIDNVQQEQTELKQKIEKQIQLIGA